MHIRFKLLKILSVMKMETWYLWHPVYWTTYVVPAYAIFTYGQQCHYLVDQSILCFIYSFDKLSTSDFPIKQSQLFDC